MECRSITWNESEDGECEFEVIRWEHQAGSELLIRR